MIGTALRCVSAGKTWPNSSCMLLFGHVNNDPVKKIVQSSSFVHCIVQNELNSLMCYRKQSEKENISADLDENSRDSTQSVSLLW